MKKTVFLCSCCERVRYEEKGRGIRELRGRGGEVIKANWTEQRKIKTGENARYLEKDNAKKEEKRESERRREKGKRRDEEEKKE